MKKIISILIVVLFLWSDIAVGAPVSVLRAPMVHAKQGVPRASTDRLSSIVLVAAPGSIENEKEIIKRVRDAILVDNTVFAVDAVVLILGKRGIEFDKELIKAIDKAHRDKYESSSFILEDIDRHESVMRKFSAKLIRKARNEDNRDFLYAWLTAYRELNEIKGWGSYYQVMAVKDILAILEHILENGDENQSKDIVDRFIPFIIETFPKVVFYWETYPYNKELINLFSTFASLYPDNPLLIQACRKFVGLEERINKNIAKRNVRMFPGKIIHILIGGGVKSLVPIGFSVTPDSGLVSRKSDISAVARVLDDMASDAKRRAMEKEIEIFTKTWSDFISLLIFSFRSLRDTALRIESDFYHHEWLESPDAHILWLAQENHLIREEDGGAFIRTPLGIDIPLKKESRRTLLKRNGEEFVSPYSFDYDSAQEVFKESLFFGLGIGGKRGDVGMDRISGIGVPEFVYAMVRPEFVASINEVKNLRGALIDSAVRLESIDTGSSEERIKETYDIAELVKKWLGRLGIMNIDIKSQGPFSTLQILPPVSAAQHAL